MHTMPYSNTVAVALAVALAGLSACKKPPPPPPPEPATGTVIITTTPSGAAVFKDRRQRLGATPLTLTRPDGTLLNLTLVKDGRANHSLTVMVEGGKQKKVDHALALASGTLVVDSGLVKGGGIFVDGVYHSKTPNRVEVTAGREVLVEVKQHGYHPYKERVTVAAGRSLKVNALLLPSHLKKKPLGWLTITCDPPSEVNLNDRHMGESPLERLPLPAGAHKITLHNEALGLTSTRTVQVKESEAIRIHVKLKDEADR